MQINSTSLEVGVRSPLTWYDRLLTGGLVLFLALLPFHLVIKQYVPGSLGTYWKEMLLAVLVIVWLAGRAMDRQPLFKKDFLTLVLLAFVGYIILQTALAGFSQRAQWGAYISLMYLPVVWLVPSVLERNPPRMKWLLYLLIGLGTIVAVGGILEFLVNRSFFPSAELALRQGFPDMYIYGTHIRRVYFTFDSPTALANVLAMILPLAVSFTFRAALKKQRLVFGAASLLIAACILVTFSRGIWVASLFSILLLVLGSGLLTRYWKRAILVLALAAGLATVLMFWFIQKEQQPAINNKAVELPPAEFATALQSGKPEQIRLAQDLNGELSYQTWEIQDFISLRKDARQVLYAHPPKDGTYSVQSQVSVPANGALSFAIALSPESWSPEKGDGVTFRVLATTPGSAEKEQILFNRYINPKSNLYDRRWRNYLLDLSEWSGREVLLKLETNPGPAGDWAFDWAGWADIKILTLSPSFFSTRSLAEENPVVEHVKSIQNWSDDETNRDRLAAWSQAANAWQQSIFWGKGLGTTGAAALHTDPQHAIITESQLLKSVVELGLPGLLFWGLIWIAVIRLGIMAWKKGSTSLAQRLILLGIGTSLLTVLIEGMVYQNLEVKQVNAFFWTLVGILSFLTFSPEGKDE